MNTKRTLRTLLLLAGAFGVLLTAVLLWRPEPPDDYEALPTLGEDHGIVFDAITRAVVEYADPTMPDITIERRPDGWRMVAPVDAPVLESGAKDILRVLERNIRKRIGPTKAEYGLDDPQVILTVEFDGKTKRFLFGAKGVSYALYAKEASSPDTITVEAWVLDEVMRTPAELRDRAVVAFKLRDTRRVSVDRHDGSGPIAIARGSADAEWAMTAPTAAPADQEAVAATLAALIGAKADVFVADGVADPESYDLGEAAADIRVGLVEDGERHLRLALAPSADDGRVRVVSIQTGSVYDVDASLLGALPTRALDWRDRRIADFQRSETWRVDVEVADASYTLEKRTALAHAAWHVVSPHDVLADSSRIDELLFELDALEATDIVEATDRAVAEHGLDRPRLTLSVHDKPGVSGSTVMRFGTRRDGLVAVRVNDDPHIALVHDDVATGWTGGIAALRERTLPGIEAIDVRRIQLSRPDETVAFTRQGVVWRISEPVVEQADNAVVDGILLSLDQMEVEAFVSAGATEGVAPALEIALTLKNLTRVRYTFWSDGSTATGRLTDDADAFTISVEKFAELNKTLEDARVTPTIQP
jgi:hypothetical protein